jgi:rhamnopyranosyl-N-acetylglucosaminyl-diphospho-decaprenol beta-1,3/1,4-galactofuranosyltransferase
MEKVIAVVVSYNRHALLVECIKSIRNQTRKPDAILVVNNGSSDFTTVWLDNQEDIEHIYQENSGSAGGYNTAISWAYKNGFQWIWCMDDDGYAKSDALELLLNYNHGDTISLLNSAVLDNQDKKSFVWETKAYQQIEEVKDDVIEGVCHPFNGTLIHRSIVDKAGIPNADLYYWGAESEYFYRIVNGCQIPSKTILASQVFHPKDTTSLKKEWDYSSAWKLYFYIRNRFQVLQSKRGNKLVAFFNYLYFVAAFSISVLIYQKKDRIKKFTFSLRPMIDSLMGDFSATPFVINERLTYKSKQHFISIFFSALKKQILAFFIPADAERPNAIGI